MIRQPTAILLVTALCGPSVVWANMGPPVVYRAGSDAGELIGTGLEDLAIIREHLSLDLRPLEQGKPLPVTAVYEIRNDGSARVVDLLFVGGRMAEGSTQVRFNGQEVATRLERLPALPESWKVPQPTIDGQVERRAAPTQGLRFQLDVPPGEHRVEVSYLAEASAEASTDRERIRWHVHYILAPARAWKSFGDLNVELRVPAGWQLEGNVPLHRVTAVDPAQAGDLYTSDFAGLPADVLQFQAQAPVRFPAAFAAVNGAGVWILGGAAAVATLLVAVLTGRRLGRRGGHPLWTVGLSLLVGVLWLCGTPLAVAGLAQLKLWLAADAEQASWHYGGNLAYGMVCLSVVLAPLAAVVAQVAALVSHRAGRPSPARRY
ncbi:MAG: hypothetical protein J5I93_17110 [Pirellulaceae bacterium]|nr:hypothetical protein [Pirellulaceae bacterium]